jgi:DNA-binding response OmpR family regulator
VNERTNAEGIVDMLGQRGISATVGTDPEKALGLCASQSPNLVVVENDLSSMSGARFLAELLKISWTTSSILIWDEDEEIVHEKTEGLGILGSVRSVQNKEGLNKLVDKFFSLGMVG